METIKLGKAVMHAYAVMHFTVYPAKAIRGA